MDCCGRLQTAMDSEPFVSGRYGRLRTGTDGLRPSTDQKVGDSSSSGRAAHQGFLTNDLTIIHMGSLDDGQVIPAPAPREPFDLGIRALTPFAPPPCAYGAPLGTSVRDETHRTCGVCGSLR